MGRLLILVGILGPLAIDTFALSAALGIVGVKANERLRISLVMASFEGGMPVLGFLLGGVVGRVLGNYAEYAAIAFLVLAGAMLLWPANEDAEEERLRLLSRARGLAAINLGLAVSVDELAIGFSLGLLGISLVVAVVWIAVQAVIAAQLGMRLGARVGEQLRERAEQLAGVALIGMAGVLLVLKLASRL
ncbi:MAG TPA: manganese efflux pump [Candidatus Dormibacteraeota bacterium]|nr:manganese efflux pump [Candidatus Dormibacteraeota bacterium]